MNGDYPKPDALIQVKNFISNKNTILEADFVINKISYKYILLISQRVITGTFLLTIFLGGLNAQKPKVMNDPTHDDKRLHFGFSLGLNTMDYTIRQSRFAEDNGIFVDVAELQPGFHVHAVSNLRIAEYFDLRFLPGISFGDRYLHFIDEEGELIYDDKKPYKVESSYLEFPLLVKYKSKRINNYRPFLISGINTRIDLATKREYDPRDQLIMIKPVDYFYELGVGCDFYLLYFKFSIELKYSMGMKNIFSPESPSGNPPPQEIAQYSSVIDRINSSMFMVSFHFE